MAFLTAFNWILMSLATDADRKKIANLVSLRHDPAVDKERALERIEDAQRVGNFFRGATVVIDALLTAWCVIPLIRDYRQRRRKEAEPQISN